MIDAYTAGLVEMAEFEPRIGRLKERLARLEGELQALLEQAKQEEERRLVFNHLQESADQIKAGLAAADWDQRRNILRAMLKRVEIDNQTIQIVYKVPDRPFAKGLTGGQFQDCRTPVPPNLGEQGMGLVPLPPDCGEGKPAPQGTGPNGLALWDVCARTIN